MIKNPVIVGNEYAAFYVMAELNISPYEMILLKVESVSGIVSIVDIIKNIFNYYGYCLLN